MKHDRFARRPRFARALHAKLVDAWSGALLGASNDVSSDVRVMSDDGLVRATEALARLQRNVQVLQARCAAELAARSRTGDESDVAKRHGFATAERLLVQATGGRYADAARLVSIGEATSARQSFTGEVLPARHPHLAAAFESGSVSIDAADLIRRFLDRVADRADRADLDDAEVLLVERAPLVGVDGTQRLIRQLEAHLDPDGVKPREDELRSARSLKIWQDASGMVNLRGAFDPANGAPIKLAIETLVGAELHAARDARRGFGADASSGVAEDGGLVGDRAIAEGGGLAGDRAVAEDRTIAQMNADALADIARLSLSSTDAPAALRGVTVIARVDADALVSARGHATIDGIEHPVSIDTARELAMSAGIAPLYLGDGSERVQLGRSRRLFSAAQKAVLVARDGGCAWPGCERPPSHTQAHHIRWWTRDRGPTDLENGILLCSHHHHRVHDDGWVITIRDGRSWFIPPVPLAPDQVARPGNPAPDHRAGEPRATRRRARRATARAMARDEASAPTR
ncbi:HNH endonuclease signature motif containing protein [Agromyces sp. Marseille-P2726]|uniref:HNH endonuclease signature motif containing protein n=1 Tax=Agromyces sp. Marseille-P2726 TaxID=2709132 RepID=UPI001C2D864E|nr:HNH endonuclease signature motif containing protein [Agromyces sp. Marseille-P2726]